MDKEKIMPTTKTGKRLLSDPHAVLGDFNLPPYSVNTLRQLVSAIEDEAREDCEREMLRQKDCDHSECIEREEEAYLRGYEAGRGWSS